MLRRSSGRGMDRAVGAASPALPKVPNFRREVDAGGAGGGRREGHHGRAEGQRHRARPDPAAGRGSARRRAHPRPVFAMILSEILSGVRLKQPLPPELAALPIEGLDFDSRRVGPGSCSSPFPAAAPMAASSPPTPWRAAPSRWRANPRRPPSFAAPWIRGRARPAGAGAGRPEFLRPARRAARPHRHHRHERQDHHVLSGRFGPARRRAHDRADRHHRVSPGRARPAGREHDAGIARPGPPVRGARARGRHARDDGSFVARAGARPRLRHAVPHRGLHEPDARPSGFSRQHGRVFRGQEHCCSRARAGRRRSSPCSIATTPTRAGSSSTRPPKCFGTAWARRPTCARATSRRAFRGCGSTCSTARRASPSSRR